MLSAFLWLAFGTYAVIVVAWIAAAVWARGFEADESQRIVPEPAAEFDESAPTLTVYVAAHNEAARIEACIERLRSQNYPRLRIVIVNDRSEDATAALVRDAMASDDRIELVEVAQLPEGWIGKTHALSIATRDISSDYLLFVDCDCKLVPGAIAAIMKKAAAEKLDFVSLWPMLDLASPSERFITPAVAWLLGLYTLLESKSADDGSQVVLGNGQFMLFSRDAYERIGRHDAVRAELAEDAIMAQRVEALGLRRWTGFGKGIYLSTRDNSFASTANATTRVVIGSLVKPMRVFCSAHVISGGTATPLYLALPAAVALFWRPDLWPLWGLAICGCIHLIAMQFCTTRLFRMTFVKQPNVFAFSIGGLIASLVLTRAYWVVTGRGTVRWGKTHYRVRGSQIVSALPS